MNFKFFFFFFRNLSTKLAFFSDTLTKIFNFFPQNLRFFYPLTKFSIFFFFFLRTLDEMDSFGRLFVEIRVIFRDIFYIRIFELMWIDFLNFSDSNVLNLRKFGKKLTWIFKNLNYNSLIIDMNNIIRWNIYKCTVW